MQSLLKSWYFPLAATVVLLGTLWGGWLHGRMVVPTARTNELQAIAAKRLQQPLAERHGNWRLLHEVPFSDDVLSILQCTAYVNRTYMHQQTGDVVICTVIVGPPGPIAAHTPEICYGSQDFSIQGGRTRTKFVDRQQKEHSLWQVTMEPKNATVAPQTVLYAWGTGGPWSAVNDPRLAHAGEPYLYKIQLAGTPSTASDEFKAWEDFLQWFLPDIETHLVSAQSDL